MRIKKKQIKESIESAQDNKEVVDDFIKTTTDTYTNMGAPEDDAAELAVNIASSTIKGDDEINEEAKSDSQRKFFNAVKKCKEEGDCGSEAIKKAADGMTMGDVEDFAYTKGELPDSVDEGKETLLPGMMDKDGKSIPATCFHPIGLAESVRPKMTKSELMESTKDVGENHNNPRRVIKTLKIKDLRK